MPSTVLFRTTEKVTSDDMAKLVDDDRIMDKVRARVLAYSKMFIATPDPKVLMNETTYTMSSLSTELHKIASRDGLVFMGKMTCRNNLSMIPDKFRCGLTKTFKVSMISARAKILHKLESDISKSKPDFFNSYTVNRLALAHDADMSEAAGIKDPETRRVEVSRVMDRVRTLERNMFVSRKNRHFDAVVSVGKMYSRSSHRAKGKKHTLISKITETAHKGSKNTNVVTMKMLITSEITKMMLYLIERLEKCGVKVVSVIDDELFLGLPDMENECTHILAEEFPEFGIKFADTTTPNFNFHSSKNPMGASEFIVADTVSATLPNGTVKEYLDTERLLVNIGNTGMSTVMAPTGTGKTRFLAEYIDQSLKEFPDYDGDAKVVCLTHRRTVGYTAAGYMKRYHGLDVTHYKDDTREDFDESQLVTCQLDSIGVRFSDVDDFSQYVVVMDEVSSLVLHVLTSGTVLNKSDLLTLKMLDMLRGAKMVLCLDADVNRLTYKLLQEFRYGDGFKSRTATVDEWLGTVMDTYDLCAGFPRQDIKDISVSIHESGEDTDSSDSEFVDMIFAEYQRVSALVDVDAGNGRVFGYPAVSCDTAKWVKLIQVMLVKRGVPGEIIEAIHSGSGEKGQIIDDADTQWKGKLVVYSPSVTQGVSDDHSVRKVFVVYGAGTTSVSECKQAIERTRNILDIKVMFSGNGHEYVKPMTREDALNETKMYYAIRRKNGGVLPDREMVTRWRSVVTEYVSALNNVRPEVSLLRVLAQSYRVKFPDHVEGVAAGMTDTIRSRSRTKTHADIARRQKEKMIKGILDPDAGSETLRFRKKLEATAARLGVDNFQRCMFTRCSVFADVAENNDYLARTRRVLDLYEDPQFKSTRDIALEGGSHALIRNNLKLATATIRETEALLGIQSMENFVQMAAHLYMKREQHAAVYVEDADGVRHEYPVDPDGYAVNFSRALTDNRAPGMDYSRVPETLDYGENTYIRKFVALLGAEIEGKVTWKTMRAMARLYRALLGDKIVGTRALVYKLYPDLDPYYDTDEEYTSDIEDPEHIGLRKKYIPYIDFAELKRIREFRDHHC